MKYQISKEFHFCASHCLAGLHEDHPCSRVHGHNYVVTIELSSEHLNATGMIVDYRELEDIKNYIDIVLDHRHLNDILPFNPTAENMSKYFYELFERMHSQITAVNVSETPKTNARYGKS